MITTVLIMCLIGYVLTAIPLMAMFKKAGVAPLAAWVPILNMYMYTKICWCSGAFWFTLVLGIVYSVITTMGASSTSVVLAILTILLGIVSLGIHAVLCVKATRAYGYGTGFAIVLFFLPVIGWFIIGYGSSVYVGSNQ